VLRRLLDLAAERLVVRALGGLEVERQVVGERHLEERLARATIVTGAREEGAGLAVVLERLLVRVESARGVAGLQQVVHRLRRLVRLGEVPREDGVRVVDRLPIHLLERLPDAPVELAPARVDQACVGDFLDEPVAEAVLRSRPPAGLEDEVEPLEIGEGVQELLVRHDALEQGKAERPADDGGDAEDLAGVGAEPVEPRLERSLDERRDRELVGGNRELPAAVHAPQGAALDEIA
jgi:hypothetical protein